jgi:hypothetical protein
VISTQEAAVKLETGAQEIELNARANCKSVGVLDGPPVQGLRTRFLSDLGQYS